MNLAAMTPGDDLASTSYCLANPSPNSGEYLIYLSMGGKVAVNLSASHGEFDVEWFDPDTGATLRGETTTGGITQSFTAPFRADAVLYLTPRR
jgi:hypothetical protein